MNRSPVKWSDHKYLSQDLGLLHLLTSEIGAISCMNELHPVKCEASSVSHDNTDVQHMSVVTVGSTLRCGHDQARDHLVHSLNFYHGVRVSSDSLCRRPSDIVRSL